MSETKKCPLAGYSEKSARDKLTRHRKRGDTNQASFYHPECGQWHVYDRTEFELRK